MALTTIWCCLLRRDVVRVTNLEDDVVAVVCPDFQISTGVCSLKTSALREERLLAFQGRGQRNTIGPEARCKLAGP
jgi:hypothetical protein